MGGLSRDHQKLLHVYVKKGEEEDVLRELLSRPDVDVNGLDEHNQGENRGFWNDFLYSMCRYRYITVLYLYMCISGSNLHHFEFLDPDPGNVHVYIL